MRFKIDWASLIVGRKLTVFAMFYFVFEGNFPRGAYIRRGDLTERVFCFTSLGGLYLEGLIHGGAYFRNFTVPTVAYNKPWSLNQDPKTDHLSALRASLLPLCPTLVLRKYPLETRVYFRLQFVLSITSGGTQVYKTIR